MTRKGPTFAIAATCQGCEHLTVDGGGAWCNEPTKAGHSLGWRAGPTPAWCPELAAARRALGRELVGEDIAPRLARAIHASDNGMGSGDLHEMLEAIGGAQFYPGDES